MNFEMLADRDKALSVRCPEHGCGAEPAWPCVNLASREPLAHLPAHTSRLKAAGVVHAPLDSRELSRDPDRRPR